MCRKSAARCLVEQRHHLVGAVGGRSKLDVRIIKLADMREVCGHAEEDVRRSAVLELILLQQETYDVIVHGVEGSGRSAVFSIRHDEVRCAVVVVVVLLRDSQNVSRDLTHEKRSAIIIRDGRAVPEVVAPYLDESRSKVPFVEAVEADNAHLWLTRRDLAVGCFHIVCTENGLRKGAHASGTCLSDDLSTDEAQVFERTRSNGLGATHKDVVVLTPFRVIDEPDFFHQNRGAVGTEFRRTV